MRAILVIGATLALCACGGDREADEANMAADNLMVDENMMMDPAMNGMDPMMNGTINGVDPAVDPATENLIEQDLNTNDPDTNLANGL